MNRKRSRRQFLQHGLAAGGVLWGYGSVTELEAAKPEHLFRTADDLLALGAKATGV